jgi:hypothetical protein
VPGFRGNSSGFFDAIYGDGSDGVVTLTSDTVLLRDVNYAILTVNKGVRIFSNGFKIRCSQQCFILGDEFGLATVSNDGSNARNSNGSTAEVSSSVPVGTPGGAMGSTGGGGRGGGGMYNGGYPTGTTLHDAGGGAGALVPAVDQPTNPFYFLGGAGGRGGDAQAVISGSVTSYTGATGSSGSIQTTTLGGLHEFFAAMTCGNVGQPSGATGSFIPFAGGGGGGAGACGNSGSIGVRPRSGWGGGGGGVVYIAARDLIFQGKVTAKGGSGGNSFSRGAGGGGGGGGFVMLVYSGLILRNTVADQIDVTGGAGGLGFSGSVTPPGPGSAGSFFTYRI